MLSAVIAPALASIAEPGTDEVHSPSRFEQGAPYHRADLGRIVSGQHAGAWSVAFIVVGLDGV